MDTPFRIIFLVYDSRSGSTLLARLLHEQTSFHVTPEIGFDHILIVSESRFQAMSSEQKHDLLAREPNLQSIAEQLSTLVKFAPDRRSLIISVLTAFKEANGIPLDTTIIIKHGPHAFFWRELIKLFGDEIGFIHIYRDPRAVILSKLTTVRPYAPYENMAWGGSALAAWRWCSYMRAIRDARQQGLNIFELPFESLIKDASSQLVIISAHFKTPLACTQSKQYAAPENERNIHTNISRSPELSRLSQWQTKLSSWNIRQIEAIAHKEMQFAGYPPLHRQSTVVNFLIILVGLPVTFLRIARHFLLKYLHSNRKIHD